MHIASVDKKKENLWIVFNFSRDIPTEADSIIVVIKFAVPNLPCVLHIISSADH